MRETLSTVVSFAVAITLFCVLVAQMATAYEMRAARGLPPSDEFRKISHLLAAADQANAPAAMQQTPVAYAARHP